MTDTVFSEGKIDQSAKDMIRKTIESVEHLEEQKKEISDQIKEVLDGAKSFGLDVKTLKDVMKLRKLSDEELQEKEYLIDIYKEALGMIDEGEVNDNLPQETLKSQQNQV